MLGTLRADERGATPAEQAVLARWSGWGSLPAVFDDQNTAWADIRAQLRQRLDDTAWSEARRTTLNAHYTPASVVEAMWSAAMALGVPSGHQLRVLEPGCGSGNFIGLAPPELEADMVGVELDPTTAALAQALYPHADIRAEGFERTRFPDDYFDLAIGNVPFANVRLYDPLHNPARLSLHNHFIAKSLALTHPGGLVAVVTSRFTLDSRSPEARRQLAALGDLVGAVRLPAGALRSAAGTDAITDVLILRRRAPGALAAGESWDRLVNLTTLDGTVAINECLARHPERVLGELRATGGQYSATDVTVVAHQGRVVSDDLEEALADIVDRARAEGLGWAPAPAPAAGVPPPRQFGLDSGGISQFDAAGRKEGAILAAGTGAFARVSGGLAVGFAVKPAKDRSELAALVGLRDALGDLLALEATTVDDDACAGARAELNRRYDAYAQRYGALNRFKLVRTGRNHPETGEELFRRPRPPMGRFRVDPDYRSVMALENFDPDTQLATKAAIFSTRVVAPRHARVGAERAEDALAICLDNHARVDMAVIADLLGTEVATARKELGELVWDNPATGAVESAQRYLAGDVRAKLAEAERAAAADPRWLANVEALRAVVPVDLGPGEIDGRLGSPWIATADIEAFVRQTLGCQRVSVAYAAVTANWAVEVPSWERQSVAARSQWGTERANGVRLVQDALNQTPTTVYDTDSDGKRILNAPETLAAREKQEALGERFAAWLWEDPQRSARLCTEYNRLFNSTVLPRYDGSHLSLPGLAATFAPHAHQRDAVWRIVSEPTVLLAHDVGAGKTATMAMAAMEMRRLGLVTKPAIVVPNHMLDQFSREFAQLYPRAKVLVADREDTSAGGRKGFVARCATGDWDAVIITSSAFTRIPVALETRQRFQRNHLAELRQAIADAPKEVSVKRLEATLARAEEGLKRLMNEAAKDDGLVFEALGVDYLLCDEAHYYKGKKVVTHIAGVGGEGSQRATDLEMKLGYLRERHGERVATFATATPIANSLSEMWVMQSYLQPERLAAAGVATFDAWAATFGRTVTGLELAPDGGSYRLNTRFARFRNVPELLTMFRATADVRSAAQLGLAIPAVAGGRPETVVVPASEGLGTYVGELVERAEQVRARAVSPDQDNMLKVAGDGRRAALDLRLVGRAPDPEGGKIAAVADRVAALWRLGQDTTYLEPTGRPSPRPGSLQVVFCDLSTPKGGQWSVYEELRHQLVARGVPEGAVRFVHEAGDDQAKADLFAACREGRVAVLVGSTEKMGVGTNVQRRLTALHHLDAPWRPADIAQREGRALRQGNQNPEVAIVRYVTESSFDVFMWQTLQRKAEFVHQVMAGEVAGREVEDVGDVALSYAEVKALATGNPLILEKAGIDNDVARLVRLRQAHGRDQTALARTLEAATARAERFEQLAALAATAMAQRTDTRGEAFAMTIGDTHHHKRPDAGGHLKSTLALLGHQGVPGSSASDTHVGALGGFALMVTTEWDHYGTRYDLRLAGAPGERMSLTGDELAASDGQGLVIRLENRLRGLEATQATALAEASQLRREAAAATARLGTPFDQEELLQGLRRRQSEIEQALLPDQATDTDETAAGASQAASPASAPTSGPGQGQPSPPPSPANPSSLSYPSSIHGAVAAGHHGAPELSPSSPAHGQGHEPPARRR